MTATLDSLEADVAEEFANRMVGVFNDASVALLLSIGHQTGLLNSLATLSPSTSGEVAAASGLNERYVREWLDGMTAARVVEQDPETATYWLPAEHAASLTTAAGPGNLARMMQIVPMLAEVEQGVVTCFRNGGGLGYDHFPRFHALMAEDSAATHDAGLLDIVVPLVPGLHQRLTAGATLADIGCGSGHAVNLLGRAYSKSTFVGYDFSDEAVAVARSEAIDWGLTNVTFVVQDVASLDVRAGWDFATAFDAIHDQADPVGVLANIAEGLRPDGAFLMVDIHAASRVNENLDIPWATFLYTVSLMHCMTVSLALDGVGLGTVWGHQTATRMLGDAGFDVVAVHDIETDPFNSYFVAIKTVQ